MAKLEFFVIKEVTCPHWIKKNHKCVFDTTGIDLCEHDKEIVHCTGKISSRANLREAIRIINETEHEY